MHARHEAFLEAAVPVAVGAVIVVGEVLHGGHSVRTGSVALGLAAAGALWMRRRWPALALLVSGVLVAALFHFDQSAGTVAVLAPAVALYSLALTRGRRAQLLAGLAAVGVVLAADLLHSGQPGILQTLGHVLLVAVPLLAAEVMRTHRSNVRLLTERLKLAERAREQDAGLRAEQERMRIARELHDVVAHTLTEINVQAASAAERSEPGDARAAFERIEDASHSAIGELRAVLGVLRDSVGREAPRAPAPGIEDISELVARTSAGGLDVQLQINGRQPAGLSDATSLAAYRILQESLTNVRRHAPGAPVRVDVRFETSELLLAVENGAGASSNGNGARPGVGIAGMRERAYAIGGRIHTGSTASGFLVEAELPYRPGA